MIALVDRGCAKENYKFVYLGESEECKSCKNRMSCHTNLEKGRRYVIRTLRDTAHQCAIFDEVIVCELEEIGIDAAINSDAAFPGATITFHPPKCSNHFCKYAMYCMPDSLIDGDVSVIEEVKEKIMCKKISGLVIAKLRRS